MESVVYGSMDLSDMTMCYDPVGASEADYISPAEMKFEAAYRRPSS